MVSISWLSLLIAPTLVCPVFHDPSLVVTGRKLCHVLHPSAGQVLPLLPGGYCHRVYETQSVPYFAQFPVVEIDHASVTFWANRLYRSDFARYGDQWDSAARQSHVAFLLGIHNGWIVPKSKFSPLHISARSKDQMQHPSPVRIVNPFCNAEVEHETHNAGSTPESAKPRVTIQSTTSSSVMPVRITNQCVP